MEYCTLPSSYTLCTDILNLIWLRVSLVSFLKYRIVGDRINTAKKVFNTTPLLDPECWRAGGVNKMCDVFLGPHGTPRKARNRGLCKALWIHNKQTTCSSLFGLHFSSLMLWLADLQLINYITSTLVGVCVSCKLIARLLKSLEVLPILGTSWTPRFIWPSWSCRKRGKRNESVRPLVFTPSHICRSKRLEA